MTVFSAEIRRGMLLRWSPLIAAAYLGIIFFLLDPWRGLWPETSAAVTQPVVVFVIAGAMTASYRGVKASEEENSDIFSVASRADWKTDLIRTAALCTEAVGLYAALAVVPFLGTVVENPPGSPRISLWLLSALGLICVVSLSYAVGRLAPARFTSLVAGVLSYCLVAFIPPDSALGLWVPALTIVDRTPTDSAFMVKALLAAAGVLLACSSGTARKAMPGRHPRGQNSISATSRRVSCVLAATSAACLVFTVPLGSGTAMLEARAPDADSVVCDDSSGPKICFWKDHASLLPQVASMAQHLEKVTAAITSHRAVYAEKGIDSQDEGIEVGYGGSAIWTGLINGALPPFRVCPAESQVQLEKRVAASTLAATWVEVKVRGKSVLQGEYEYTGFDPTPEVKKLLKSSESEQKAQATQWVDVISAKCGKV
ncbi:hypothetical protein AB0933_26355 [Streptomyces venezuelae]|uniref:hypothetical protein n=1 Tax=Streptomyces venezuelae TaxID=54571 RepID=UPI00345421E1